MSNAKIPFNIPPYVGKELDYVREATENHKICGDGPFTAKCNEWIEKRSAACKALLTTSGTQALELAAILCDIQPGDEVIMPSFTFSSTANAFVMRGAELVFVDIRPDTKNLDEKLIEDAITEKTKVIVPVHYAGVSCEMDAIMDIADRHGLIVVEDAAQAVTSSYNGRELGSIGDYGCYSFHETKNYSMGEGGAILVRDDTEKAEEAEIIREKGTDRSRFLRGQVDKYSWVTMGSSFLPSDMNAAYLWAQLENWQEIYDSRMHVWNSYYEAFKPLQDAGSLELPVIPDGCVHNAHMFYILTKDLGERTALIDHLKEAGILAVFHYVPLHSSEAGLKYGRFHGEDKYTSNISERLVRLPLYYGMKEEEIQRVCERVREFYR